MRIVSMGLAPILTMVIFPFSLVAQGPAGGSIGGSSGAGPGLTTTAGQETENMFRPEMQKLIAGRVYALHGGALPKATVEITNNIGSPYQSAITDKTGDFQFEFSVYDAELGKNFMATIKVTRKGFQIGHKILYMDQKTHEASFAINLRPNGPDDPTTLSPSDLIKELTPRLQKLAPADGLSPKEQKGYERGVQEFQDGRHMENAIVDLHKAASANPNCLKCRTMLGLAEMSWNDWDDAQIEFGESVNAIIKDHTIGSAEPLLAYGTMVSWKHDPAKASAYFLEALTFSPKDPLALRELGRTQCQEFDWYSANLTLKKAIEAGAGPEAKLLHAQALLYAGTPQQASDEFNNYTDGRPFKSLPLSAQDVWSKIQDGFKHVHAAEDAKYEAKARGEIPLDYLHHPPTKDFKNFVPAANQQQLLDILTAVGKNVAELFNSLPNVCAIEKVRQESLDGKGKERTAQDSKYRYLALIPDRPTGPSVDEYRADVSGRFGVRLDLSESGMLTEGFISAPLVFHPAYQAGGTFELLGSQAVEGRKLYVIAYAQDPAKTALFGTFTFGNTTKTTYKQGLAWINAENYQVVHMTSDLLEPLPLVRLKKETTDIYFSEIQFKRLNHKLWLPAAVTVTLEWNGRSYRNQHAYSEFLVSNVDETQKIGKPKERPVAPKDGIEPAPIDNSSKPN
jgi:tetratricopeptide (TPR) repeat protein